MSPTCSTLITAQPESLPSPPAGVDAPPPEGVVAPPPAGVAGSLGAGSPPHPDSVSAPSAQAATTSRLIMGSCSLGDGGTGRAGSRDGASPPAEHRLIVAQ